MLQFQGFKPDALNRMAKTMGYSGDMKEFDRFLNENPDKQEMMDVYSEKAKEMMMGGYVKGYANGGVITASPGMENIPGTLSYEQALNRQMQRDVKEPWEAKRIAAALALGPGTRYTIPPENIAEQEQAQAVNMQMVQANPLRSTSQLSPLGMEQARSTVLPMDYVPNLTAEKFGQRAAQTTGQAANPQATAPTSPVDYTQGPVPQSTGYQGGTIAEAISNRAFTPALPYGTTVQPVGTAFNQNQAVDTTLGQVSGTIAPTATTATTAQATGQAATPATTMTAGTAATEVGIATDTLTAAQGAVDPRAIVAAQSTVNTGVSNLNAVQGTGILMNNPNQRKVETGELVSGAANAQTAANFTEQVQAAEATPTNKATIQGQLEGLMAAFEGGNTPVWAAGAMRNVTTQMANRGLGASSMAAQALIQGAMESALPIAQADASIIAQFEAQNLSNRQQRAMLAAQQRATFMGMEFDQSFQARVQNSARIGDIANMNFTADQQVALENSRVANTVNLQNLNNSQAMVMAEAAALSQLDMANLSNRQQSAVMNAQSFMQMDMANLSSQQQTEMFKAQSRIQSLFTDQAAENAARQFNATSQNQTDQFFASLANTTSQFNASQSNAQAQFNAGQTNAMAEFQANLKNQRDQFNAQNRLVIDQNNAQWRRQIATADTVAINRANEINATNLLGMSTQAYNDLWQYYSDSMEFAWTSVENEQERINELSQIQLAGDIKMDLSELASEQARYTNRAKGFGNMITEMFVGGTGFLPGLFNRG